MRILVATRDTLFTLKKKTFSCYTIDWTIYLSNIHPFPSTTSSRIRNQVLMELNKEFIVFVSLSLNPIDFYTQTYNKTKLQNSLFHAIEMK